MTPRGIQDTALPLLDIAASHDLGLPHLQSLAEAQGSVHVALRFLPAARRPCAACSTAAARWPVSTCQGWPTNHRRRATLLPEEDYFLVCLKTALDLPAVQALRDVLASPAWLEALASLPGYGVQRPGEVLSLTRALPWWNYRAVKRGGARHGSPALAADA